MRGEERQNPSHRGDPLMGQRPDGAEVVQTSDDATRKPADVVDVAQEPGCSGGSDDVTREPSVASPRLIPVLDSQPMSVRLPLEPEVEDTGKTSISSDRNCAPSQAPVSGSANYDRLSCGQLRELRKQRGYYKEGTKAALRTRSEAMDVAMDAAQGMQARFVGHGCSHGARIS